jgi:hypothetical protein
MVVTIEFVCIITNDDTVASKLNWTGAICEDNMPRGAERSFERIELIYTKNMICVSLARSDR